MERYEKLEMEVVRFDVEDGMEQIVRLSPNTATGCQGAPAGTTPQIT